MANQEIEKLLILQDRDQVVRRLRDQLDLIPREILAYESEIGAQKKALQDSKTKLQGLEVQRNDLDMQVGSARERINKYKTQQLEVKKNEEYRALTHEIDITEQKISDWEETEIGLLLAIDAEAEEFSERESTFGSSKTKIEEKIALLEAKRIEVQGQIKEAEANLESSKTPVDAQYLTVYERLSTRIRLPVIVAVEQQICTGCHLRVSNDTVEEARKGEELTTCDNCGRVVYLAS